MGSFVIASQTDEVCHVDFDLERGEPFIWRRPGQERYELLVWDGTTLDGNPPLPVVRPARRRDAEDIPEGSGPPAGPGTEDG